MKRTKDRIKNFLIKNGFVPMKTNMWYNKRLVLTPYYINRKGEIVEKDNGGIKYIDLDIPDKDGYQRVQFNINGKPMMKFVHRLVAQNFVENPYPETRTCVNHKDKNILNNSADNLEWVSVRENSIHAVKNRHLNKQRITYPIVQIVKINDSECIIINTYADRRSLPKMLPTSIHKVDKQYILACCDKFRYKYTYRGYYWVYKHNMDDFLKENSLTLVNYI